MRIDDQYIQGAAARGLGQSPAVEGADSRTPTAGQDVGRSPGDWIQLSTLAEQLRALQPGSEAREAEIARLRAEVEQGQYRVDAARVSEALLEESLRETKHEETRREVPPLHAPDA